MAEQPEDKVEALFHEALQRKPGVRAAYLDQACGEDKKLREEVESLLLAHQDSAEFLEQPAWSLFASDSDRKRTLSSMEREANLPFERLGEFHLIRRLGEGGMGTIYLAVQESVDRQVALKVIRPERMGSLEATTRFRREVEAICELRHPHIVTIFGSGEDRGVLYYAMELLSGKGLDQVLREASRGKERIPILRVLEWVKDTARALQNAHEKGIIHRDVKPSNILITEENQAMLLDFGVARRMNLSTLTLTGEFRGTPHYASPEQIRAKRGRIDGRTDIYSLGATLYEAVTGRVPFEGETTEQVFRKILEEDPPAPRRLNPTLSQDLETVIVNAMEKDPLRRYATMQVFADDLERFLQGEMILARPAGFATRAWKRVQRNPVWSTAIGVSVLAGVSFLLYMIFWQYPQILAERDRADQERKAALEAKAETEKEAETTRQINTFLRTMLASADPGQVNKDVTVAEVLDRAAGRIDGAFENRPEIEAALRDTMGNTYRGLGLDREAEKQYARALALRSRALGEDHPNTLASMNSLAIIYKNQGEFPEAEALHRKILAAVTRTLGENHPSTFTSLNNLASVLVEQGKLDEGEAFFRRAMDLGTRWQGEDHPNTLSAMSNLADILKTRGKLDQAESLLRKALDQQKQVRGEEHPDTLETMNRLGCVLLEAGRPEEAERIHSRALEIRIRVLGEEHPKTLASMNNLASVLYKQKRLAEAEPLFRKLLKVQRRVKGDEHPHTLAMMSNFAGVVLGLGKTEEAENLYRGVLVCYSRVLNPEHPQRLLAMSNLGVVLWKAGKLSESEPLLREAFEIQSRVLGEDHPNALAALNVLARVLLDQGKCDQALPRFEQGLAIYEKTHPPGHTSIALFQIHYSECLERLKRFEEAETRLLAAFTVLKAALGEEHPGTRDARTRLYRLYAAWGKPEKGEAYRPR